MVAKQILPLLMMALFMFGPALGLQPAARGLAQSQPPQLCALGEPETGSFPDVALDFRAYDAQYNPVGEIRPGDVQVQENSNLIQPRTVKRNEHGVGLNVYFLVDLGNRTDQETLLSVLNRFGKEYLQDQLDRVAIYTNFNSKERHHGPWAALQPTTSGAAFIAVANSLGEYEINDYYILRDTVKEVISQVRGESLNCARPTMLVLVMGPDVLTRPDIDSLIAEAVSLQVPVHVAHTQKDYTFNSSDLYKRLATETGGVYAQVTPERTQEFTQLDQPLFSKMAASRVTYTAGYRSPDGSSGDRKVQLLWKGQTNPGPNASAHYAVRVDPAEMTINTPLPGAQVRRTATQKTETGYLYDLDNLPVEFSVSWPDGHPRQVRLAELLLSTPTGREAVGLLENPADAAALKFDLDLRRFTQEGENALRLEIRLVDELGIETISAPVDLGVLNVVPPAVTPSTVTVEPVDNALRYILAGAILVLTVIVLVLWRKLARMAKSGAVGAFVEKVRKTIVGGRNSKPIAILKVLDGPSKLINEDLNITTESVSLGRDPAMADFTFYADSNSSVSGLHARVERRNGQWFVTGVSQSGNETFVDGQPIPNFQPVAIQSGQRIRLGYHGQQPVEFLFSLPAGGAAPESTSPDAKRTKVNRDTLMPELPGSNGKPQAVKEAASETVDENVFEEFRKMD